MATPSDGLIKGKWWESFGDPQLNALEETIAINNQNVKQAEAQFREARATVLATHANYYPTIGSSPSISQTYETENSAARTFLYRSPLPGSRICGAACGCPSRMRWKTRK